MKKIVLALAAIASIAIMTSCEKKCSCDVTVAGVTSNFEYSRQELEDKYNVTIEKCSDMDQNILGQSIKCTNTL